LRAQQSQIDETLLQKASFLLRRLDEVTMKMLDVSDSPELAELQALPGSWATG
jgi:hypothetical protein